MNLGPTGGIVASLSRFVVIVDVLIDFNNDEIQLQQFRLTDLGFVLILLLIVYMDLHRFPYSGMNNILEYSTVTHYAGQARSDAAEVRKPCYSCGNMVHH